MCPAGDSPAEAAVAGTGPKDSRAGSRGGVPADKTPHHLTRRPRDSPAWHLLQPPCSPSLQMPKVLLC